MKSIFILSATLLIFSCSTEPKPEPTAQELLQQALEKAKEEGLTSEDLSQAMPVEQAQIEPKVDSVKLIIDEWHRDFRMFNGMGTERGDSIKVNFSGVYELQNGNYNFKLSMGQTGIHLRGSYCGYTNTKSDCGMESQGISDPLVKGRVDGDTAFIYYYSNYANDFGWAKIYFQSDSTLIWKSTQTPKAPYVGTPYEGELILKGDRQEDYEVWPNPDIEGC